MILQAINYAFQFSVNSIRLNLYFQHKLKTGQSEVAWESPRQRETSNKLSNVCLMNISIDKELTMFISTPQEKEILLIAI